MTNVVVFGSINMDIVTFCRHHPRLGETVLGDSVAFHPGGKGANQAIAAARCAGKSILIGSVGADDFGKRMLGYLAENSVDTSGIAVEAKMATGAAVVTVDANGSNTIVVTPGANAFARAPSLLPGAVDDALIALAQLESPVAEITRLFSRVRSADGITILNPSPFQPLSQELLAATSILIVNEHEFAQLAGTKTTAHPEEIISDLNSRTLPVPCCIVTSGAAGIVLAQTGRAPIHVDGHQVHAVDTTGAGDCFAGWFAAEIAAGRTLHEAARWANAAAAISATRAGAGSSMPSKSEVESLLRG
jgi:ribokinase